MTREDEAALAALLGVREDLVRRLRERGRLHHLAVGEQAVRERLYRAHRAYVAEGGGRRPAPVAAPGVDPG